MEKAEEFPTYGQTVLEDVRDMFKFLQHQGVKGRYFDGVETEAETARGLKADAAMAMGGSGDYGLMGLEEFFQKHFAGK